jgi:hypothetical protein
MTATVRRERPAALAILLVPAAIAASGALLLLRLHFQPPTVPAYALAGSNDEVAIPPGGQFELEARPSAPVTGAVGARAFLLRGDELRPWDPPFRVSRDGSIRIAGAVDALFANVPRGRWEVVIAVGRPETLPTAPHDVLRKAGDVDAGTAAWRLVRRTIVLGS